MPHEIYRVICTSFYDFYPKTYCLKNLQRTIPYHKECAENKPFPYILFIFIEAESFYKNKSLKINIYYKKKNVINKSEDILPKEHAKERILYHKECEENNILLYILLNFIEV